MHVYATLLSFEFNNSGMVKKERGEKLPYSVSENGYGNMKNIETSGDISVL